MKKIAIVTLTDNNNYGNRLQNYALVSIIELYGYNVKTIWLKKGFKRNVRTFVKNILGIFIKKYRIDKRVKCRTKRIVEFTNKYLKNDFISKKNWMVLNKKYDKVVVGSDQVWNPDVCRKCMLYLLPGIDSDKKIAYAASMGVHDISDSYKLSLKQYLTKENFQYISVREEDGLKILLECTDRDDIELLLDPTMLIPSGKWEKLEQRPCHYQNEKYILTYFLGELSESREKAILSFAEEHHCSVINLMDKDSPYYTCNPNEFLYLEHHAFMICTDSFHSCVFAILYERPFVVFEREQENMNSMGSRIDTLLHTFQIENRKFHEKINQKQLGCDYSKANKILENEREKSLKFLEHSLKN